MFIIFLKGQENEREREFFEKDGVCAVSISGAKHGCDGRGHLC